MINRQNWLDTKEFLSYLQHKDRDIQTILQARRCLRHLLEWARENPFGAIRTLDPTFPTYLLTTRNDGKSKPHLANKPLSVNSMDKICQYNRAFLKYIRSEYPVRYKSITQGWVETMRPGLKHGLQTVYREHSFYTVEQVRLIAALKPVGLRQERDQAACVFLFLSAMRAQAFASLTLKCIDWNRLKVSQFPELGVMTKGRKAAKTQLLRVSDLLIVVRAWDAKLRAAGFTGEDLWFPVLTHLGELSHENDLNFVGRRTDIAKGLARLCKLAGVTYMSLHKLRHGHIVYMMRRIKTMKQLKSLSQNVMHSSVAITDGIYGRLVSDDIADTYEEFEE